jgi:hypothetical protein
VNCAALINASEQLGVQRDLGVEDLGDRELEKLIEMHKNAVLSSLGDDAKKSIDELVEAFSPDIARTPP